MFNTIISTNATPKSKSELVHEYKKILIKYTTSEGINRDIHEDADVFKCITLPVGDLHVVVEITGVDCEGLNFSLFGRTTTDLLSADHIELSEMVIENDEIVIMKRLLKMADYNEESFNDYIKHPMTIKTINKICIAIVNYSLCENMVGQCYQDVC